jgi:peptide/nickel transport system substrate-binding protein
MAAGVLRRAALLAWAAAALPAPGLAAHPPMSMGGAAQAEDLLATTGEAGRPGGRLVVALRSEPKTLNPLTASADISSREVMRQMTSDLIHINRASQAPEPALAKSWTVTPDGLRYTLKLRQGLRFSDGHPFDADDVVFTFESHLDERSRSTQRDLLIVGGQPIRVQKVDALTVRLELAEPYAAAERLFDSLAILPRHLLAQSRAEGKLAEAWGLSTPPAQVAGLGPFRLKTYVPGERLVLEKNPHYWKKDRQGRRLPYLDEVVFLFVPTEDAQVIRFQSGEADTISRLSAENYAVLDKDKGKGPGYVLADVGPSLEYSFLFFNLNDLPAGSLPSIARRQEWFRRREFRQAVSLALDRDGIVRLVYQGRATPLGTHVTPGNRLWVNAALPRPRRALPQARTLLQQAGFSWKPDGTLVDGAGQAVEFSIATSSSNPARLKMATIIQDDLRQLGMTVHVTPLESRGLLDRVLQSRDYEAALMALGGGDVDPNGELDVWVSSGKTHLWNPAQARPATPWEAEIDTLMRRQVSTLDRAERKRLYDRVQQIVAENLPLVPLVSPNLLVGAKAGLSNFRPGVLDSYTLWNSEELFWR